MAAVAAGASRQDAHEIIRRHSLAAGEQVKMHGRPNDLLERLAREPAFKSVEMSKVAEASAFVGRSPEQVEEFVERIVKPIRERYAAVLGRSAEMKV
jgi:adenylosuccinate lyase